MGQNDRFANRQPHAKPLVLGRAEGAESGLRGHVRGKAAPRIGHVDHDLPGFAARGDRNFGIRTLRLPTGVDAVLDEVNQQLLDLDPGAMQGDFATLIVDGHGDPGGRAFGLDQQLHRAEDLVKADRIAVGIVAMQIVRHGAQDGAGPFRLALHIVEHGDHILSLKLVVLGTQHAACGKIVNSG